MSLRQPLTLAILQTEISASPFADAETWQHSDQRDQNENKNDYEFDYGENVLNAVMPRHSDRVPIGNTTRNYACSLSMGHQCGQIDRKLAMGP